MAKEQASNYYTTSYKMKDNQQVIIYFEDKAGQLMQVTHAEYRSYWRHIGWKLQGTATPLPGMASSQETSRGLQAGLL